MCQPALDILKALRAGMRDMTLLVLWGHGRLITTHDVASLVLVRPLKRHVELVERRKLFSDGCPPTARPRTTGCVHPLDEGAGGLP
jgi:hypothetical protein